MSKNLALAETIFCCSFVSNDD